MSTQIDMGYTGAKRQSWRHANPRDTLRAILAQHPAADRDELLTRFTAIVLMPQNAGLLETIIEYWFTNNLNSLVLAEPTIAPQRMKQQREQKAARIGELKDEIRARVKVAAKFELLKMLMPNNKPLRACTGAECRAFGGWLTRVAGKISPTTLVGKAFNEAQLRELFEGQ